MLPLRPRVVYLHGFASSPFSRKAQFFTEKLSKLGVQLEVPDLAQNDFAHLTITRQLRLIEDLIGEDPAWLIGSSLGGYLASLYAAEHPNVQGLVLLAPAFNFHQLWLNRLSAEQAETWKRTDRLEVFYYAEGRPSAIWYKFLLDAESYAPYPDFHQPALILHGNGDDTVPVQYAKEFARGHENARLVTLETGHEMTEVLDTVWDEASGFLKSFQLI
jgi:uncharacterized protein